MLLVISKDALMSIRFIKMGLMPELGSTRILAQSHAISDRKFRDGTGKIDPDYRQIDVKPRHRVPL